jgi:hypothetical protein
MLFMMKQRFATLLYFVVAVLFAAEVPANTSTFSCKDSNGKPLLGSSPPEGCVGEICETQPNGARECRPPPETPEQRKKREDKEKKKRDCEKKFRDTQLDAYGFLDKYQRREDIEVERDREIVKQLERINDAKQRRDWLRDRVASLERDAEFYGPKHPMPEELSANLSFNRQLLGKQEALVSTSENEMTELNKKYDRMVKRREDLLQRGVEPVSCDE